MSTGFLSIIVLLALGLAEARILHNNPINQLQKIPRITRDAECSNENLNSIFQSCQESLIPESSGSIARQFCGSSCKDEIASYASSCGHTSFSVNITGTCLVNNNHPQCVFAVILIRPGVLSCRASAVSSNNELSTISINPSIPPICSLYSTYNSTGEYFQIEFDSVLMRPTIQPPLSPPWSNCSHYYEDFGHPVSTEDEHNVIAEIECSQSQLDVIIKDCEEAVKPVNNSNISQRFCGGTCRTQISAYAASCNMTYFSLNITGSCQTNLTDTQCIFAVVLIRPGISVCSATSVTDDNNLIAALQTDTTLDSCCVLHSSVNTTGEFYEVQPDPLTGTPLIQPPLMLPWESCSAYTELTCNAVTTTMTTVASTTARATTPPKPVSTTTELGLPPSSDSASSMHPSFHVLFYIFIFIFILNVL